MTHEEIIQGRSESLQLGPAAARWIVAGLLLAVVGLGAACALGLPDSHARKLLDFMLGGVNWSMPDPHARKLFFLAYLVAFVYFLSITLGALFFVMLQHLSRAGWSVSVRRLAEALSGNIALMALLFVPLLFGLGDIYEWSHRETVAADPVLAGKAGYLNPSAFAARFALYFLIWGFLAWYLRSRSIRQDASGDVSLTRRMERLSAPGMLLFSFTVTFAAFDLLMSLNPHWFSTMMGVYFFTECFLSFLVVLTLLALLLQRSGRLRSEITVEHYHDLGKLTFAIVFFWGYIAFSQYMLIWYANMPEETQFFIPRQIGPWAAVSLALVACHLLIPFLGLLSRAAKRRLGVFAFWAVWLLAAQLLDLYWLVMPNLYVSEIPAAVGAAPGTPLPRVLKELVASNQSIYQVAARHADFMEAVRLPLGGGALAVTFGLLLGMGGLYLASTAWLLRGAALLPIRDPRLKQSLSFENT
ncbi:MAG: quinol:cytochrome C oxidoreductase [Thermoguttaceae bacterium]|jgi:ABC-type multidrug transport system fused ATPase/permease subunit